MPLSPAGLFPNDHHVCFPEPDGRIGIPTAGIRREPPHHRIGMCASLERRINVMIRKEKVFDGGSPFATYAKENYNVKHRQNESYGDKKTKKIVTTVNFGGQNLFIDF